MEQIKVGPLTADEWALFTLGDDDRNPLPPCCGNLTDSRSALMSVFSAGGDPELCWRTVAAVWPDIESHVGDPLSDPILAKLHGAYIAGRDLGDADHPRALAWMMQREPADVQRFIGLLDDSNCPWNLATRQGRIGALARLAGHFVGYVLDPDERHRLADALAARLDFDDFEMGALVDVLRACNGLPYDPTHPDHRGL